MIRSATQDAHAPELATLDLMNSGELRRALAVKGLTPATAVAEASGGRSEEACVRPATLVEGQRSGRFRSDLRSPGPKQSLFSTACSARSWSPTPGRRRSSTAEVAAAVRERTNAGLATVAVERQIAGRSAGHRHWPRPAPRWMGSSTVALPEDEPPHPVRDLAKRVLALDQARGALERAVGGPLPGPLRCLAGRGRVARARARSGRRIRGSVGVSKSHATLPFDGEDLERYLRLPYGHRSSVFAPASRSLAPVRAWALRLWPWEGKDLFHGLVRVEVAPGQRHLRRRRSDFPLAAGRAGADQRPGSALGPAALRDPLGGACASGQVPRFTA